MRPILIAGPTASGKSALALALARAFDGLVINADSQQVYAGWRILSARPSAGDEAEAPHALYGHVGLAQSYSVGDWLRDLGPVLARARTQGKRPIIVGGTGLYFTALTQGLAPIPQVPEELRARGQAMLDQIGLARFSAALAARDPATAQGLDLANPRRVLRAWEVLEATGLGLAQWQARTSAPLIPLGQAVALRLMPPRDALYARCDARFDQMLAAGALEEVAQAMALDVAPEAQGWRALGALELRAYLLGQMSYDQARHEAMTSTRRYAKRQLTWCRNKMPQWHMLDTADAGSLFEAARARVAPARSSG